MSDTNTSLKILYHELITKQIHKHNYWHKVYKDFLEEVKSRADGLLNDKPFDIQNKDDIDFLQKLLRTNENGVTGKGQSNISDKNFKLLISDHLFLKALQELMLIHIFPDQQKQIIDDQQLLDKEQAKCFDNFKKQWTRIAKNPEARFNINRLLINRATASCTFELSTIASEEIFNTTFNWFIHDIFTKETVDTIKNDNLLSKSWYEKNKFLMRYIHDVFKEDLAKSNTADNESTIDEYYLSIFIWCIYENAFMPFVEKKQVIKYGPPGTGKTFSAFNEANLLFEIWNNNYNKTENLLFSKEKHIEKVQFHPSYGYEDFIEGLRPVLTSNQQIELCLVNGIFKDFCLKAGKWEIDFYTLKNTFSSTNAPDFVKDWEDLTLGNIKELKSFLNDSTHCNIPNEIKSIFESDYWSFIFEHANNKHVNLTMLASEIIPPYFFIIDEINRAELSRVLGELMFCLEYRGVSGSIKTQYSQLNTDKTTMLKTSQGNMFFVPHNIYLIGTMNTIDRSIESFDFALRRRFSWIEVLPNYDVIDNFYTKLIETTVNKEDEYKSNIDKFKGLKNSLKALNQKIEKESHLGTDYQIGHSYVM